MSYGNHNGMIHNSENDEKNSDTDLDVQDDSVNNSLIFTCSNLNKFLNLILFCSYTRRMWKFLFMTISII